MRKTELIVALDVDGRDAARRIARQLKGATDYFKVGLELFTAGGPATLSDLTDAGFRVFLDLKLHDIPRTVARAVQAAAGQGASMLTVHAGGGAAMLRAAAEAARAVGPARPAIIAVTTLTSLDENDLRQVGVARDLATHTLALAELALECGADGLVCSPLELAALRRRFGSAPLLIAPGVRPLDGERGDQKRVATPTFAAQAGASCIVVGRPIVQCDDPAAAARRIGDELASA
jgi:orotidine-5'-phosphate decarboxylase